MIFFRHGHCHRPSAVQGTQVGSCQDGTPGWDQWDHPSQHQLWTRWYVYRAKVLRVVEGGEQLDSMGHQAGEGAITDRVLLLLQGTKSGEREGQSNIGWDGGLHLAHEAVQSHADVRTRAPQSTPCHVQSHPSPVWTRAVSLLARQGWEGHPHQVQPPPRIRCLPSQLPVVQECLKAGRCPEQTLARGQTSVNLRVSIIQSHDVLSPSLSTWMVKSLLNYVGTVLFHQSSTALPVGL